MSTLVEFAIALFLSALVVIIHYETLRLTSSTLLHIRIPPRQRILVLIFTAFFAHLLEIALFAASFMVISDVFETGSMVGTEIYGFYDYLYYSMITYSTLGHGDIVPLQGLRLLTGMESLIGLMMITWTASFTYLAMERFWKLH